MDALADLAEAESIGACATGGRATPVVILSGFLGAGKTTLLKHVLENVSRRKVGVVVNDVAAVNVDANLVRSATRDADGKVQLVQMQNGCACCSASDDLFKSLRQLSESAVFDVILVECTGVAEPKRLWANLDVALEEEEFTDKLRLAQLVTVVDAPHFFDLFASSDKAKDDAAKAAAVAADASALGAEAVAAKVGQATEFAPEDPTRLVADLLAEQLESADVVLVNKVDLVQAPQIDSILGLLENMCPLATVMKTEFCKLPDVGILLDDPKRKAAALSTEVEHKLAVAHACQPRSSTGHSCADDEHAKHKHSDTGECGNCECARPPKRARMSAASQIKSFVYRSRRAFDPKRFAAAMLEREKCAPCMRKVLRSKGYCWLANHCGMAMYWSQAGVHTSLHPIGAWWAEVPRTHWPSPDMPDEILADFAAPFGDRRQELVFIGVGLDEAAISAVMDGCLLDDSEMEDLKQHCTLVEEVSHDNASLGQHDRHNE